MADAAATGKSKNDPDGAMMYVACSRCKAILDVRPGNLGSITHSLCEECRKVTLAEIEALKRKPKASAPDVDP